MSQQCTVQVEIKLRTYQDLWLRIAKADTAVVVVTSAGFSRTLIQAVRKEKCLANAVRKTLDLPRYGEMTSKQEKLPDGKIRITFSLAYNGDKL